MISYSLFCIALICYFVYATIWNITRFSYFIKCLKIKKCSDSTCKFNSSCTKYREELMEEDTERLLKLIEQLK